MAAILTDFENRDQWGKRVRSAQMNAQKRAYDKFYRQKGIRPAKIETIIAEARAEPEAKPVPAVTAKKQVEEKTKEAGVSRSTGLPNSQGFACPTCWGVPKTVRNDGFTVARHLPVNPEAKRYRDTEFCDGQGKIAVAVMQSGWTQGSEPRQKMSAKKWRQGKGAKS